MIFEKRGDLFYRDRLVYLAVAISLFLVSFAFLYVGSIDKKFTGYITYTDQWCIDNRVCERFFIEGADSPYLDCVAAGLPSTGCNYCFTVYVCPSPSSSSGSSGSGGGSDETPVPSLDELDESNKSLIFVYSTLSYVQSIYNSLFSENPLTPSSSSSTGPTSNLPSVSTSVQDSPLFFAQTPRSCNTLSCQQQAQHILLLSRQEVALAESAMYSHFQNVQVLLDKYNKNELILKDYVEIDLAIRETQQIKSQINSQLFNVTNQLLDDLQTVIIKQTITEKEDKDVKDYYVKYEKYTPPLNEDRDCKIPVDYIAFKVDGVLSSGNLIGNGNCKNKTAHVSPFPLDTLTSPINNPLVQSNLPTFFSGSSSTNSINIFLLGEPSNWGNGSQEAIVISKDTNGVFDIGFLLAPSHSVLKEKIEKFAQNLLFGSSDSESEENLGFILQTSPENEIYSKEIPYFLWIVLVVLVVIFFLLNRVIMKYNYMGNNSNKSLINSDAHFKNNLNFGGHRLSVEKMIKDALKEHPRNKKIALVRLSVISKAYKDLDKSSKEKLAQLYEELIYSIKKAN